jgi:hypothetical protein
MSRRWFVLKCLAGAVLASGCGARAIPTSLFVAIETAGPTNPTPDEIRVSVFGEHGALFTDQRLPASGPLVPQSAIALGTVTIYVPPTTETARLDVRALSGGAVRLQGIKQASVLRDHQLAVTVVLGVGPLTDTDGDGVPDPIDDCPVIANMDQSDTDGDGVGDACEEPSEDGGALPDADGPPPTGLLTITEATVMTRTDLTAEGTIDWAHWGSSSADSFDHKSAGGNRISDITPHAGFRNFLDSVTTVWTDGTPTPSASTNTSVYAAAAGGGFTLTVTAETTARTLRLYVGGSNVNARLTATLSDGSAPDATYSTAGRQSRGGYEAPLDISFRSTSAGQTLTLTWSAINLGGSVAIRSATLF